VPDIYTYIPLFLLREYFYFKPLIITIYPKHVYHSPSPCQEFTRSVTNVDELYHLLQATSTSEHVILQLSFYQFTAYFNHVADLFNIRKVFFVMNDFQVGTLERGIYSSYWTLTL
jgi:hypothetical protein